MHVAAPVVIFHSMKACVIKLVPCLLLQATVRSSGLSAIAIKHIIDVIININSAFYMTAA